MNEAAILFGYGSIGRYHAKALAGLMPHLFILDSKQSAMDQARIDFPAATVVGDFDELDNKVRDWNSVLAVIATWGPSHAEIFHKLADRGVRRILCEKPLTNSIDSARRMVTRADQENISLAVHHYMRYCRVAEMLGSFARTHELGAPVALVVAGGASCLVTNGIHWIDFATELFEGGPQRVISSAVCEQINPRSPELGYFGGTATWSFDKEREATISLSNQSSIALTAQVYFRNAIAEMDGAFNAVIRRRDMKAVADFPGITRTGPASECLYQGKLPGILPWEDCFKTAITEVLRQDVKVCPAELGASALSACIGALISARDQKPVDFPIPDESPYARETWSIS